MNIYLIGYRGCGKTSVAPIVALHLGLKSMDSDREIEVLVGRPIAEIFKEHGEAGFREWESSVIEGLAQKTDRVIALGGGAVLDRLTRQRLKETGKVVWLKGSPETLWSRISQDEKSKSMRPNLTDQGGLAEVQSVLEERTPIYESCADWVVDVDGVDVEEVAKRICQWIDPI
jgi:shikimate kinase